MVARARRAEPALRPCPLGRWLCGAVRSDRPDLLIPKILPRRLMWNLSKRGKRRFCVTECNGGAAWVSWAEHGKPTARPVRFSYHTQRTLGAVECAPGSAGVLAGMWSTADEDVGAARFGDSAALWFAGEGGVKGGACARCRMGLCGVVAWSPAWSNAFRAGARWTAGANLFDISGLRTGCPARFSDHTQRTLGAIEGAPGSAGVLAGRVARGRRGRRRSRVGRFRSGLVRWGRVG